MKTRSREIEEEDLCALRPTEREPVGIGRLQRVAGREALAVHMHFTLRDVHESCAPTRERVGDGALAICLVVENGPGDDGVLICLLYTSPSPRD